MTIDTLKFEKKPLPLIFLMDALNKYDVIDVSYTLEEEDNLLKIDSFEILNENDLHEIGFAIFLKWIYSKNKVKEKNLRFNFIKLNEKTIFLVKNIDKSSKFLDKFRQNSFEDSIYKKIPNGSRRHSICPIMNSFKYNMGIDPSIGDIEIPRSNDNCDDHKKEVEEWIEEKLIEDENYGRMFGGSALLLDVNPKISKFISESDIDALFNSFLAIYSLLYAEFNIIASNSQFSSPFISNELDVFLWNENENRLIILETSNEFEIGITHFKRKMYSAAVLKTMGIPNYDYKYITLGSKDDIKPHQGHGRLFGSLEDHYGISFDVITLAPEFGKIEPFEFNSGNFRNIYQYYLGEVRGIFN